MKILLLHNYYQQPGGEDIVVAQEKQLLVSKGHKVWFFTTNNDSITTRWQAAKTGLNAIYSRKTKKWLENQIKSLKPDIVHVHNFFPKLTPSVYYACGESQIPVVQTLHNFRLICPNGLLFRGGKPCDLCVGRPVAWPGVRHACYRNSRMGSAALASMLALHHHCGTWRKTVSAYIALSDFARNKLIAGGLPENRLFTKSNFVFPDPGVHRGSGGFGLYVGRLSAEKGIHTLISAWKSLPSKRKLKIVGDGPLRPMVEAAMEQNPNIEFLGRQINETVLDLMDAASFLLFPSECYENSPRVIVEAFAKGLPVIASNIGSTAEFVEDLRTGLLFYPGDPKDLARSVEWFDGHLHESQQMRIEARNEFKTKYTAENNYRQLMKIYEFAMKFKH